MNAIYKFWMVVSLARLQRKALEKIFEKIGGRVGFSGTLICESIERVQSSEKPFDAMMAGREELSLLMKQHGQDLARVMEAVVEAMKEANRPIWYTE